MSYLRILSITGVLLLLNPNAHARVVDQDFERCASAALKNKGDTKKVLSVNVGGLKADELNHSESFRTIEFHMRLNRKSSGEELGVVKCTLNRSGDVLATNFE